MTTAWPLARDIGDAGAAAAPAGAAAARAQLKTVPEDFQVHEIAAFEADGDGEHLFLRLEKRALSTPAAARWLACQFEVAEAAVGYAGMKDTRAVTAQWFSVQTPHGPERLAAHPGLRLLEAARHRRKLRRGELAGNRFLIHLRNVRGEQWPEALAALRDRGAPNYFGAQRFARDNLAQARAWLAARRRRRTSRFRAGLYLSVLRSFLFNEVLARRVLDRSWHTMLPGDIADDAGAAPALPTGPLWGRGRSPATARAAALEAEALAPHEELREGLEHAGVSQARRALVLRPRELEWHAAADAVTLSFTLRPGGYATTLLAEAFHLTLPRDAA